MDRTFHPTSPAAVRQPVRSFRLVEYDAMRRRLWILGQRCHHGATGSLVAALACLGIATSRQARVPLIPLAATGGLLMVHDWKDRGDWFRPGYGAER